jgi:hypothetical protein
MLNRSLPRVSWLNLPQPEPAQSRQQLDRVRRDASILPAVAAGLWLTACGLAMPAGAQSAIATVEPVRAVNAGTVLSVVRWSGSLPEVAGRMVQVRFALYQDQAGGPALWSETQTIQVGADGRYSVLLGATSVEGLPQTLFQAGEARWIEARLASAAGEPSASPVAPARSLLAAVPYAFKAMDAESLAGRAATDYVTREELQSSVAADVQAAALPHPETTPTGSGTTGYVPIWTGTATLGNSLMAETGTSVGIDTATPATTLDVNGASTLRGNLSLPALGTATASGGFSSPVFAMNASSFLAGGAAVNQEFAWEVQAQGNNTSNPSSALSLLYASGTHGVSNTGLSILPNGSFFSTANLTTAAVPATASAANASPRMYLQGSAWNSTLAKPVQQNFAWSTIPTGNNTTSPSANLTLQYSAGTAEPAATGLSFAPNGVITFAAGQTFPGVGGSAGPFCVATAGGFESGGTTFVGPGFTVPAAGNCTPWSGFTKTASTVILTTSGAACLSSDGKTFTLSVSSADPDFVGAGSIVSDYIQLTRTGTTGSFSSGTDQGQFSGSADQITCTSSLLQLPGTHD